MYIMERIETLVIEDTIGEAFMAELKGKQQGGNLGGDEIKLLNRYLKPAIANLTISAAVHELGFDFNAKGLQLTKRTAGQGNEEKSKAADNQAEIIAARAEGNGNLYLQQGKAYLLETASVDKFKTFFESPLYPRETEDQRPQRNTDKNISIYNGL